MNPLKKGNKVNKRKRSKSPTRSNKKQDTSVEKVTVTEGETSTVPTVTPQLVPLDMTKRDIQVQGLELMELLPPDLPDEGPLDPLLMKSDSLDKLLGKTDDTWRGLAKSLKDVFLPYQQELPVTDQADYVATLGTVYYTSSKSKLVSDPENSGYLKKGETEATVSFLEKFMKANGQWDYIEKQEWFKKGDYVIAIDMNYYPDRSGYKESPLFHKDTGGNNVFVNLVFDNEKPIEATEWFADLAQPSKKRTEWRKGLVPQTYLDDLEVSRKTLQGVYGKGEPVSGGVSEGPHTYVSWVDDLVWHATPTDQPRIVYSAKAAQTSYTSLDKASKRDDFAYDSKQFKRKMLGVEILGTIAESKDTELYKWLEKQNLGPQDVDVNVAKKAWRELYNSSTSGGKALFVQDAAKRDKSPWRIIGAYSEANAYDERLKASSPIKETPIGLSGRRRANSLDPQAMAEVRKANQGVPRSFLRTWVRMLPKDSGELSKAGFVQ
ncbi:MAG TPA: hypothetical protein VGL06_14905 [Pseudonocardiaceae bacterium]|jgi:hypothetical protein